MKKFGYVLSGGGARGFAHLGLLKYLEEMDITPFAISGTSAGAIVGTLYASGRKPEEILDIMKSNSLFGWTNLVFNGPGIFSLEILEKVITESLVKNDFEGLKYKLFITSTDIKNGVSKVFSEGKVSRAVMASSAIPVIFEPITINEQQFVDGGLLNNFPVEPLVDICDVIIGSHVNKLTNDFRKTSDMKTIHLLERCFHLALSNSVYSKVADCDLFFEPELYDFDMFDIKRGDEIFERGYKFAGRFKEQLLRLREE